MLAKETFTEKKREICSSRYKVTSTLTTKISAFVQSVEFLVSAGTDFFLKKFTFVTVFVYNSLIFLFFQIRKLEVKLEVPLSFPSQLNSNSEK